VIGLIKGALDGPFFLCMFTSSDWSDKLDLPRGSFFAKRSGEQPKVCYDRESNELKGGGSGVVWPCSGLFWQSKKAWGDDDCC
jgi:hypothetical protein